MGWNELSPISPGIPLFTGIPKTASYYFTHSYYMLPQDEAHILAYTEYGKAFAAIIGKGNIIGLQHHVEKSGKWGLRLIDNFFKYYTKEVSAC